MNPRAYSAWFAWVCLQSAPFFICFAETGKPWRRQSCLPAAESTDRTGDRQALRCSFHGGTARRGRSPQTAALPRRALLPTSRTLPPRRPMRARTQLSSCRRGCAQASAVRRLALVPVPRPADRRTRRRRELPDWFHRRLRPGVSPAHVCCPQYRRDDVQYAVLELRWTHVLESSVLVNSLLRFW